MRTPTGKILVRRASWRKNKSGLASAARACAAALVLAAAVPSLALADSLSLNFTDVPLNYVLNAISGATGRNFAINKEAGARTVSVSFHNVDVDTALSMLGEAAGVAFKSSRENFYVVSPATAEAVSETGKAAEEAARAFREELVKVFDIKYVTPEDVEKSLGELYGKNESFRITRLAQKEGSEHSRVVVAAPDEESMLKVAELIETLDAPKPMIEIEVVFMETFDNNDKNQGIDWEVLTEPILFTEETKDGGLYGSVGMIRRLNPLTSSAAVLMMQSDGKGRVLANPRMRTVSGRKAEFSSETKVPILSKNKDGDINTDWKDVGISLEILPSKLADGTIRLDVSPRVSSIIGEKKLGDVVAPVISERKSNTTVFLRHGELFVIGGLMSDREIRTMSKVPVLHQIPLFGELFKSTKTTKERSNITVILRPREIAQNTEYTSRANEKPTASPSVTDTDELAGERSAPEAELKPSTGAHTDAPAKTDTEAAFAEMAKKVREEQERKIEELAAKRAKEMTGQAESAPRGAQKHAQSEASRSEVERAVPPTKSAEIDSGAAFEEMARKVREKKERDIGKRADAAAEPENRVAPEPSAPESSGQAPIPSAERASSASRTRSPCERVDDRFRISESSRSPSPTALPSVEDEYYEKKFLLLLERSASSKEAPGAQVTHLEKTPPPASAPWF